MYRYAFALPLSTARPSVRGLRPQRPATTALRPALGSPGAPRNGTRRVRHTQMIAPAPAAASAAALSARIIATTADIGPFTNVNVESAGLIAAIAAGGLVAAIIATVIVRF